MAVQQTTRRRIARRFESTGPALISAPSRILGHGRCGMMTWRIGLATWGKNDQDAGSIGRSVLRMVNAVAQAVLAWPSRGCLGVIEPGRFISGFWPVSHADDRHREFWTRPVRIGV